MRCETCRAPAIVLGSACVFCRTPISESHAPAELLDYLADRLPDARVQRFGLLRNGPVRQLKLVVGTVTYEASVKGGRLQLLPQLPPAQWLDSLLASLSRKAASDADLRSRLSRSGWQLR